MQTFNFTTVYLRTISIHYNLNWTQPYWPGVNTSCPSFTVKFANELQHLSVFILHSVNHNISCCFIQVNSLPIRIKMTFVSKCLNQRPVSQQSPLFYLLPLSPLFTTTIRLSDWSLLTQINSRQQITPSTTWIQSWLHVSFDLIKLIKIFLEQKSFFVSARLCAFSSS